MSAREFEEWKVFCRHEQLSPSVDRFRQAQLIAGMFQGPVGRKGGKGWATLDFMAPDPWTEPSAAASKNVTPADKRRALTRRGRK